MKIILVRHGETIENLTGIISGYTNGTLSENGINQAKLLSESLSNVKINAIYSSDLERAKNTTVEILKVFPNISPQYDVLLREIDLKEFVGRKRGNMTLKDMYEKIEPWQSVQERARKIIESILEKEKRDGHILIVSHAGMKKAIISVLLGIHYDKMWDIPVPKNASVSLYSGIELGKFKEEKFNLIYHLNEDKKDNFLYEFD